MYIVCSIKTDPRLRVILPLQVVDSFGESHLYPDLSSRQMEVTVDYINSIVGVALDAPTAAALLSKMQLKAVADNGTIRLSVPPSRSDILHACDVVGGRGCHLRAICGLTEAATATASAGQ
jgi:phenylalanyl-tRNA synthetase beta subunit